MDGAAHPRGTGGPALVPSPEQSKERERESSGAAEQRSRAEWMLLFSLDLEALSGWAPRLLGSPAPRLPGSQVRVANIDSDSGSHSKGAVSADARSDPCRSCSAYGAVELARFCAAGG